MRRSPRRDVQTTAYTRQEPGTPFSSCSPRSAKLEPRSGHEVAHRLGHEDLGRARERGRHARRWTPRDRRPCPSIVRHSPVCSPARTSRPSARRLHDRLCAADPARRAVERGEEAVAGGIELAAAIAREAASHYRGGAASRSAQRRSPSSACLAVEPTMSVKRTVARMLSSSASSSRSSRDEALDRIEVRVAVLGDDVRGRAGHRLVPAPGIKRGEGAPRARLLAAPAQDERRDADRAEDVANVRLVEHAECGDGVARAGRERACTRGTTHDLLLGRHAVEGQARALALGDRPRTPVAVDARQLALELVFPQCPTGSRGPTRCGVACCRARAPPSARDESPRTCTPSGPPSASATSTARSTSCGVQDRPQIVDALLDRGQAVSAQPVGEAHTAVVEADQPTEAPRAGR